MPVKILDTFLDARGQTTRLIVDSLGQLATVDEDALRAARARKEARRLAALDRAEQEAYGKLEATKLDRLFRPIGHVQAEHLAGVFVGGETEVATGVRTSTTERVSHSLRTPDTRPDSVVSVGTTDLCKADDGIALTPAAERILRLLSSLPTARPALAPVGAPSTLVGAPAPSEALLMGAVDRARRSTARLIRRADVRGTRQRG